MGAGILLISIHDGQLYFLFGEENKHADTPGYADFGGGSDGSEELIDTAVREFTEETTGFWGSIYDVKKYIDSVGARYIDIPSTGKSRHSVAYRTYIVPVKYSIEFETFYNNNHAFLESKLPKDVYRDLKIFEKSKVKWVTVSELLHAVKGGRKPAGVTKIQFRPYYMPIVEHLIQNHDQLYEFASKSLKYSRGHLGPA
jgi:hypothetical protein